MQTKSEPSVWRTLTTIVLMAILLIIAFQLYQITNDSPDPISNDHKYQILIDAPGHYITPYNYNLTSLLNYIINYTKDLNTPHYISVYSYLRENFTLSEGVDPRLPVETILRGSGSYLDLNLLYTSMLLHLDYDAYTIISELPTTDLSVTLLFYDNLTYIFDMRYFTPIVIDNPSALLDNENYEDVVVISPEYSRIFDNLEFYIWIRDYEKFM